MIDRFKEFLIKWLVSKLVNDMGAKDTSKYLKSMVFDIKYAEFATDTKTPSERYAGLVLSARQKKSRAAVESDLLFRELRRDRTWEYKRIENIFR